MTRTQRILIGVAAAIVVAALGYAAHTLDLLGLAKSLHGG
jgi:hypothetical protein